MPFGSQEFRQFAKAWGMKQSTPSPGFPQSNGQSKRFVRTIKKMLKKADRVHTSVSAGIPQYAHHRRAVLTSPDSDEANAQIEDIPYPRNCCSEQ